MTDTQLQELTNKYIKFTEENGPLYGLFIVDSIKDVPTGPQPNPHPFTIGTRHVSYAYNHCGGILGKKVLEHIPCCYPLHYGQVCNAPYAEHTIKTILFVRLVRNLKNKEAAQALYAIKPIMESDKIDGVGFVNTKEFQIERS